MVHASTLPNCVKYFLSDSADTPYTQHYNTQRETESNNVCTICGVPVETADKHFPTEMDISQSLRVQRTYDAGVGIRHIREKMVALVSVS
jgi:ribosomal protein L34E